MMYSIQVQKIKTKEPRIKSRMILSISAIILVLITLSLPAAAYSGERIFVMRTIEDPSTPPDPAVCEDAPFQVVTQLGASVWSVQTRSSDGMLVNDQINRLGNATACTKIASLNPFTTSPFYIKFTLDSGDYVGEGNCTITSNTIPVQNLILASCTLNLTSAPPDVLGGAVTSMSVFNPFRLPGFNTGSIWTIHAYLK